MFHHISTDMSTVCIHTLTYKPRLAVSHHNMQMLDMLEPAKVVLYRHCKT